MKTLKMNLANIQGKMNRREMKLIMAGGSGGGCQDVICTTDKDCCTADPHCRRMNNDPRSTCYNN